MMASELILLLNEAIRRHGDKPVCFEDDYWMSNEDPHRVVFKEPQFNTVNNSWEECFILE